MYFLFRVRIGTTIAMRDLFIADLMKGKHLCSFSLQTRNASLISLFAHFMQTFIFSAAFYKEEFLRYNL